jgi:hypothetical protein
MRLPDGTRVGSGDFCAALEGDELIQPLRRFAPPIVDMIQERPYLEMQSLFDPDYPPGRRYYNKAHILRRFESGAIDATLRFAATMPPRPSSIGFQQLHGTAARVSASASAFPHRYDHHVAWISPVEDTASQDDAIVRWARECWDALCPHVDRAVYVNALDDAVEEDDLRVRQAYGENYQRLKDLKKQYDPTNLFRQNSNIRPTRPPSHMRKAMTAWVARDPVTGWPADLRLPIMIADMSVTDEVAHHAKATGREAESGDACAVRPQLAIPVIPCSAPG